MSQDGTIYGIPKDAYALGLAYNIPMLEAAGFDHPPATWQELADMAVALDRPRKQCRGLRLSSMMAAAATGWHFTNIAYGFGATPDSIIHDNGDGTYCGGVWRRRDRRRAEVHPGATLGIMMFCRAQRRLGQHLRGAGFRACRHGHLRGRPVQLGLHAVPRCGPDPVWLRGGPGRPQWPDHAVGRQPVDGGCSATADQQEAAAYFQLWRQFDPVEMQTAIEVTTEAVGMPTLPLFVGDYQEAFAAFREPYNKLPVENYAPFIDAVIGRRSDRPGRT